MLVILIFLLLFTPVISVMFYERLRGYTLKNSMRVVSVLFFAILINIITYVVIWLRVGEFRSLGLDTASMRSLSFVLMYLVFSSVSSIALPYMVCFLRPKRVEST